jgi:hypothetical protein
MRRATRWTSLAMVFLLVVARAQAISRLGVLCEFVVCYGCNQTDETLLGHNIARKRALHYYCMITRKQLFLNPE